MKKTLLLCALVALALPATALAHGGRHGRHGNRAFAHLTRDVKHAAAIRTTAALASRLSGTGSSFGSATASSTGTIAAGTLAGGTYSASIGTDWSKATAKTFGNGTVSCAPATATLTLASSTNSASTSLTGKTCSWTSNGKTGYAFIGTGAAAGSGTLASLSGTERVLLREDPAGTVRGNAFVGLAAVETSHITAPGLALGRCHNH
jgi:hypothetical protein